MISNCNLTLQSAMNPCWPSFKKPRIYTFIFLARRVRYWKFINPRRILNESHILDSGNLLIRARRNGVVRGLAAAFALGAEGVQIGTAFLPCAASGASEAYRSALSLFAANGTDLHGTLGERNQEPANERIQTCEQSVAAISGATCSDPNGCDTRFRSGNFGAHDNLGGSKRKSLPFYRRNRIYDSADRGSRICLL